jgi:HAD superfamily hydrolase (TIGR01509 family)
MTRRFPLALCFDFDGLLFDTEHAELDATARAAATVGAVIDETRWRTVIGTAAPSGFWLDWVEEQIGPCDRAGLRETQRRLKAELIAELPMKDGATELLAAASNAAIPCAVVSASPLSWVIPFLERVEATVHFVDYITRERVTRHKPDPAHYVEALRSLGIGSGDAGRCVAFEDSWNGSRSAVGAGMHTIVVPHSLTDHADFSHAHRRIGSLADVTIDTLFDD